jgi:hypothetical protein
VRIPICLVAVFAGVVDLLAALEDFRRIFRVCRIDSLRRGVMQTMRKGNPRLPVLIDQCLDLFRLELDALLVPLSGLRNVAARNL